MPLLTPGQVRGRVRNSSRNVSILKVCLVGGSMTLLRLTGERVMVSFMFVCSVFWCRLQELLLRNFQFACCLMSYSLLFLFFLSQSYESSFTCSLFLSHTHTHARARTHTLTQLESVRVCLISLHPGLSEAIRVTLYLLSLGAFIAYTTFT